MADKDKPEAKCDLDCMEQVPMEGKRGKDFVEKDEDGVPVPRCQCRAVRGFVRWSDDDKLCYKCYMAKN